jgi:uncharacterized protein YecE (DUF72 family)
MAGKSGTVRVGIGGWVYEDWRGTFYPEGLPQKRELEYASSRLSAIEINGTFYGTQKPESFAKWFEETPDDFVFTLKGPRYATNRRVLAEATPSIERFVTSGILELKHKLGPINWQFAPTKTLDLDDFAKFLALLPHEAGGRRLQHAVEVRHESFADPDFVALCREHGVAVVLAGDSAFPQIADITAPFVYARIMGTSEDEPIGYGGAAIRRWADAARSLAKGNVPKTLSTAAKPAGPAKPRDVFLFVISGHKVRNPEAAMALIEALG